MNTPDSDDPLLKAYRKASSKDAGAPGDAVRRAILDEAAAAARRRMPAANDSRFHWRAVAGVAVLGVALLLWRQVDRPLPQDQAATTAARSQERTVANADMPGEQPLPAASLPPAAAKTESEATPLAQAEAPSRRAREQLAESAVAAADSLSATDNSASAAQLLLRRFFPGPFASRTPPQSLWLVLDEAGNALGRGQLGAGEDLSGAARSVEAALAARSLGSWQTESVPNLHGLHIQLSIARAQ